MKIFDSVCWQFIGGMALAGVAIYGLTSIVSHSPISYDRMKQLASSDCRKGLAKKALETHKVITNKIAGDIYKQCDTDRRVSVRETQQELLK